MRVVLIGALTVAIGALLVSSLPVQASTRVEVGPVELFLNSGNNHEPLTVEYEDRDTANPGDDEVNTFQRVKEVRITVDARNRGNEPGFGSTEFAIDFWNVGLETPLWPTMTTASRAYTNNVPHRCDAFCFPIHVEKTGWGVNGCMPQHFLIFPGGCSDLNLGYESVGTYDRQVLPIGGLNETSTDWVIAWREETWYGPCIGLEGTFELMGLPAPHCLLPEPPTGHVRESLPNLRIGWQLGEFEVRVRSHDHEGNPADRTPTAAPMPFASLSSLPNPALTEGAQSSAFTEGPVTGGQPFQSDRFGTDSLPASGPSIGTAASIPWLLFALLVGLVLTPIALYHRIRKDKLLDHPLRATILSLVRSNPGINEREIAKAVGVHRTTVAYHTRYLRRFHWIEIVLRGREVCHFENDGTYSAIEKERLLGQRNLAVEEILVILRQGGPLSLTDLARHLGVRRQSLTEHVRKLVDAKRLVARRMGRRVVVDVTR